MARTPFEIHENNEDMIGKLIIMVQEMRNMKENITNKNQRRN